LFDYTYNIEYFMIACLEMFNSKWEKIDFLRLDKYIMLLDIIYEKFFSLKRVLANPNVSLFFFQLI
jgi:hypothetical protein